MASESGSISLKPPRGTHDILPGQTERWQYLEAAARAVLQKAGYREVRVPIFEHTDLFKRGVGDTTDVVNKEMYTFPDKSERSLTLRPEGTAGVVRAYLNGGLHRQSGPVKLWYVGPMFRYESPQAGRQRQFHQIGIEAFGSGGPLIDADVITEAVDYLQAIGVRQFQVQLNSIGCPVCRPIYRESLRKALQPHLPSLCEDCQERFHRNPLRMLDCKSKNCQSHYTDAPAALDHLCAACKSHFDGLLSLLGAQGVSFEINKRLVRGLDYYTRTVLEIISLDSRLGAQSTICAGGRYDNLVETLGGPATPAVGWALGMERLMLLTDDAPSLAPVAFIVSSRPELALKLATDLRRSGISCDLDYPQQGEAARSFGKQLQQANKSGSRWAVIAGDDEIAAQEVTLKDMQTGSQDRLSLNNLMTFLTENNRQTQKSPATATDE